MITMKERDLAERHLCLDLALQVDSNADMLSAYQSVTERMRKLQLLIEHESSAEDVYGFMIRKSDEEKREIYTKNHLKYLVKRTLEEFS